MGAGPVDSNYQPYNSNTLGYGSANGGYQNSVSSPSSNNSRYMETAFGKGIDPNYSQLARRGGGADPLMVFQEMFKSMMHEMRAMFEQMMSFLISQFTGQTPPSAGTGEVPSPETPVSGVDGQTPSAEASPGTTAPEGSQTAPEAGSTSPSAPEATSPTDTPDNSAEPVGGTSGGCTTNEAKNESENFLTDLEATLDKAGQMYDGILALKDKILATGKKKKKAFKVLKEIFGPLLKDGKEFTKDTLGAIWKKLKKLLSSMG